MSLLSEHGAERRHMVSRMLLASMVILLLAQALNGVLTWSALRAGALQTLETTVQVAGHDRVFHIQNALRLGKPITQMHGLPETLADLSANLPFAETIAVTLPDGRLVEVRSRDAPPARLPEIVARALDNARTGTMLTPDASALPGQRHVFVLPVSGRGGQLEGGLTFVVAEDDLDHVIAATLHDNLVRLALATAAGALLLLACSAALLWLRPSVFRRGLYVVPFLALLLAQTLYAWHNIETFREAYVEGTYGNVQRATDSLANELDRLFAAGVGLERLHGLDAPFQRMLDNIPELDAVAIHRLDGSVLARLDRSGERDSGPFAADDSLRTDSALHGAPTESGYRPLVALLSARLSAEALAAGARQRLFDAGTVVITSIIFIFEQLILLATLLRRRIAARVGKLAERPLLARPAAFGLLFAWALPLSFIPLHMQTLYRPVAWLPQDFVLALPVAVEMLFALIATLLAGRLADRRGWQHPFLLGALVCATGSLASALAPDALAFVASRALVGLGYGLAWMGIQAHVFNSSSPRSQTHAIASLVAGIFAGHICGSATGGMLATQFGHESVFVLSAIASLMPIAFALLFMRRDFVHPAAPREAAVAEESLRLHLARVRALLVDRNFAALLALCVIPFSIVQVGLLYFALPVHLGQQGIPASDIGRIIMVYGLSVIYLGPLLGRWVGRFERRKPFIVAAGVLGGAGLAALFADAGLLALATAVFLLGLASSLGGPAQASYALRLDVVERLGKSQAMAIQRTADKLGQMLGPLIVGALFALIGSQQGLALTGALYIGCSLLFLALAREPLPTRRAEAVPA